jgi:uncharacterized protein
LEIKGEYAIPAPREQVWEALNDPLILEQCIPGCEEIEKLSDTEMEASVTVKVGPVKAKFKGKVTLSDLDPPNGYTIIGEGQGGAAGFAKGGAKVALADDGDGTLLTYEVDATVGGKLAQIGSRLIEGTARKMADQFFSSFTELMGGDIADDDDESDAAEEDDLKTMLEDAEQESGINPMIWIGAVILLWMLGQWYFNGGN